MVGDPDVAREHNVVVVGGGVSAIGAVVRLERDLGITDVVALERADGPGGTWRHNSYPGCACDVPSPIYSYEFAPNPEWSRVFAEQPEILRYVERVAEDHGVTRRMRFGVEVLAARWDAEAARWDVETSDGPYRARVLLFAPGALHEPSIPDVPGVERFEGRQFHSSHWDHDHDLEGRRVAVVGTGASAVQLIPYVQAVAAHTTVVQRTPLWVWPKPDWRTTRAERWLYRRVPATQRAVRRLVWAFSDVLLRVYADVRVARLFNGIGRLHLRVRVRDRTLREALTPDWVMGCKRITFSNSYYRALTAPDATLVPHGLREVRPRSIVTADGVEHAVDTIVWCTGFHVADPPFAERLIGVSGRTLAEEWAGNPRAYLGASIAGFPNAFMLFGPNIGTASCMPMLEAQLNYITAAIRAIDVHGLATLDIRPEVVDAYKAEMNRRLERSTWQMGGCRSFYLDSAGDNYLVYGGTMGQMMRHSREFDLGWFTTTAADAREAVPA